MIEKGKGRYIENLWIIQVVEANLNFVLHTIWGHQLIWHGTTHSILDSSHYALSGQTCNNAILNKMLFLDISRQSLSPGILSNFDATAAFDWVLAGLLVVTCKRMGFLQTTGQLMLNLLHSMHFHLITGLGRSQDSFNNATEDEVGQGVLQGSSSAAPMYFFSHLKRHCCWVNWYFHVSVPHWHSIQKYTTMGWYHLDLRWKFKSGWMLFLCIQSWDKFQEKQDNIQILNQRLT